MLRLPFEKALIYLVAVKSKFDADAFGLLSERFFRGIFFGDDPPISHVLERLSSLVIPKSILLGKYDLRSLSTFLKKMELMDLHEHLNTSTFESLIYNADLRLKIDVMSMCSFRPIDIFNEVKHIDDTLTEDDIAIYLDCFADYANMDYKAKRSYINIYIDSTADSHLFLSCLENRSLDKVRSILGLKLRSQDPMELVNRIANITSIKLGEHLVNGNEQELQKAMTMGLRVADILHKLGAGSQSAIEELKKIMSEPEKESETPATKSYEELEKEFLERDILPPEV